jgi:hypothetical protein
MINWGKTASPSYQDLKQVSPKNKLGTLMLSHSSGYEYND